MRLRTGIAAALATLAVAAPAAQADDNSLFAAYVGHQEERKAANQAYLDALADAEKGSTTDKEIQALIAANEQINANCTVVRNETAAQEPSTEQGAKAKKLALKEFDLLVLMNKYEINSDKAALADDAKKSKRWFKRFVKTRKSYRRTYRRTHKQWISMGFEPIEAKVVR